MNDDTVLFYYDPTQNPQRHRIDGVPLTDLTVRHWAKLSEPLRGAVIKCPFYRAAEALEDAAAPEPAEEPATEAAAPRPKKK